MAAGVKAEVSSEGGTREWEKAVRSPLKNAARGNVPGIKKY